MGSKSEIDQLDHQAAMRRMAAGLFTPDGDTVFIGNKPPRLRRLSVIRNLVLGATIGAILAGSSVFATQTLEPSAQPRAPPLATHAKQISQINTNPFEIDDADNDQVIAKKLLAKGETFMALAVTMESVKTRVYKDAVGKLTIGAGYCIDERIQIVGRQGVAEEMRQSGINQEAIYHLIGGDRTATITKAQAVNLLARVAPEYQSQARNWVGESTFDELNPNQRASLSWVVYNVGADKIEGFHRLKSAVEDGNIRKAAKNLAPWYKEGRAWKKNERAGNILGAIYSGGKHAPESNAAPGAAEFKPFVAMQRTGHEQTLAMR